MFQGRLRSDETSMASSSCFLNSPSRKGDLADKQPKKQFSSKKRHSIGEEICNLFTGMSLSEVDIDIVMLQSIIEDMKSRSVSRLSLSDFLTRVDKISNKKENEHPTDSNKTKAPNSGEYATNIYPVAGAEEDDSISSSVDSSWSSTIVDSPPLKFNFKTPQKIFTFTHTPAPSSGKNGTKELPRQSVPQSESLFTDNPSADAPPPPPPCPPLGPKFLFPDIDSPPDNGKQDTTGTREFNIPGAVNGETATFNLGSMCSKQSGKSGPLKGAKSKLQKVLKKTPAGPHNNPIPSAVETTTESLPTWFKPPTPASPPPKSTFHFQVPQAATNSHHMSVGSADNEMEDGCVSPPPVCSQPVRSTGLARNGIDIDSAGPFPEQNGTRAADTAQAGSPIGFKPFTLFKNSPSNGAKSSADGLKKKPFSAKKKRSTTSLHNRKGSGVGEKELDELFANIRVTCNAPCEATMGADAEVPEKDREVSDGNNKGAKGVEGNEHPPAGENSSARYVSPFTSEESAHGGAQNPSIATEKRMSDLADMYKTEGKKMYMLLHYDIAFDSFSKALKAAPLQWHDRANVLSNRAAALIMMERIVEAIEDCEEAARIDPSFVKVHTRRGRALLKLGMLSEATDAFMHVLGWVPAYSDDAVDPSDDNGKEVARAAMKQVMLAKALRDRLRNSPASNARQTLQTAEELLQLCPFMRDAQAQKARAMCQLHQWKDAKKYMDFCVCSVHSSMQRLTAHPAADLSELNMEALGWGEISYGIVAVNMDAVKAAMLAMGSAMARTYLISLKNMDKCRTNCSADVMAKISDLLGRLAEIFRHEPLRGSLTDDSWDWVILAHTKIRLVISAKNDADEKFRGGAFKEAILRYTDVLQVDPDAHIWNAIMFGNRAASSMRLGLFSEAVSDCHQSLVRDPLYTRAFLRRARANRALGNHSASVRDYKKYLKSSPPPADQHAVEEELREVERSGHDGYKYDRFAPSEASERRKKGSSTGRSSSKWGHGSARSRDGSSSDYSQKSTPPRPTKATRDNDVPLPEGGRRRGKAEGEASAKVPDPAVEDVMAENYYVRLGVTAAATEKDVKTAYRKLALRYHPDKNKAANAAELFKSLTEAYTTLADKVSRRTYDETIIYNSRGGRRNRH